MTSESLVRWVVLDNCTQHRSCWLESYVPPDHPLLVNTLIVRLFGEFPFRLLYFEQRCESACETVRANALFTYCAMCEAPSYLTVYASYRRRVPTRPPRAPSIPGSGRMCQECRPAETPLLFNPGGCHLGALKVEVCHSMSLMVSV